MFREENRWPYRATRYPWGESIGQRPIEGGPLRLRGLAARRLRVTGVGDGEDHSADGCRASLRSDLRIRHSPTRVRGIRLTNEDRAVRSSSTVAGTSAIR